MSAPQQPSRRDNEPVEAVAPQTQLDPVSGPDGDSSGDQDIDTQGRKLMKQVLRDPDVTGKAVE